jgi:hypothetical protein
LTTSADALQAPPAPSPPAATAPATGQTLQHLKGKVTMVEPLAQMRASSTDKWGPCTVGAEVSEGTEFRTGPKGRIQFQLPPDQTAVIERLTTCTLLQAVQRGGKVTTDLGMRGKVSYQIEAAGLEHDSTVRTPNSTLAVRGTKIIAYDQRPFPPEAVSLTGRVQFSTFKRQTTFGRAGGSRVVATADRNPAEQSLYGSVVDPTIALARMPEEQPFVASLLSSGAVFTLDNTKTLPIVRGGVPPSSDAQLQPFLVGRLNFVLRWTGNTNLDLLVGNQAGAGGAGEVLYPAVGLNTTPSGGKIPFDHQGGPKGGIEIAYWQNTFPSGAYPVSAEYTSGATTPFTIDVFKDGKRVPQFVPSANGGQGGNVTTLAGTAGPGISAPGGIATLGSDTTIRAKPTPKPLRPARGR